MHVVKNILKFINFIFNIFFLSFQRPLYLKIILQQIIKMGFFSLIIICCTSFFIGMVLALQIGEFFNDLYDEPMIKTIVLSIIREIGPVFTGLIIAGRLGSSISAEIATMKVTEQIDALYSLNINPLKYLVITKIFSSIIIFPILVTISNIIAIFGGYIIYIYKMNFDNITYIYNVIEAINIIDIYYSIIKSIVFGFIITTIASYNGLSCSNGSEGVGISATKTVTLSSILILIVNYIIDLIRNII